MPRRSTWSRLRRVRRPLIALVLLLVALAIGYGVKAARAEPLPGGSVPASTRSIDAPQLAPADSYRLPPLR